MAEIGTAAAITTVGFDDVLACPACRAAALETDGDGRRCRACGATFAAPNGIVDFVVANSAVRSQEAARRDFWDQGWDKRFGFAAEATRTGALALRKAFHDELTRQKYPSVTKMGPDLVGGKLFLNVGCGGGQEGLLFAGYGCRYLGVDFSANAARLTAALVRAAGYDGTAYQAEAERLPLRDNCVDVVYSNGVLHHTPNTTETLTEIRRVMKPGAVAYIGLYASRSVHFFWYRLHAILRGNLTPRAVRRWLDANTEGEWQTEGRVNQLTKTYTKRSYAELLRAAGFDDFQIEQTLVTLVELPVLGRIAAIVLPQSLRQLPLGHFGMILMARCRTS